MEAINNKIEVAYQKIIGEKQKIIYAFVSTFSWGILAHAYCLFNNNMSHDWLNAFIATPTEELWKVELGRFFVPIYRSVVRGEIALPWVIGILAFIFISISVFIIIKLFDIDDKLLIIITAGIMVTNITVISQAATYLYELDINMFALLLSLIAVYFWYKSNKISSYLLTIILLIVSMGLYQSYISVAATMMLILSVAMLLDTNNLKLTIKKLIIGGISGIVACGLYYVLSIVACKITGVILQGRTNVFYLDEITSIPRFYAELLFNLYRHFYFYITHSAYAEWLNKSIILFIVLVLLVVLIKLNKKRKISISHTVYIIIITLLIPISVDMMYVLARGSGIHDLMTYSFWMVFVIVMIIVFKTDVIILKQIGCIIIGIMLCSNIIIANTAYLKKDLEERATFSTMTRVVSKVENMEGFDLEKSKVAFIGTIDSLDSVNEFDRVKVITGIYSDYSIPGDSSKYYYNAYKAYFNYILQYPVVFCDDETHAELKANCEVEKMPVFPSDGSIAYVNDVLVVKLGE